jgi:predicted metal-dependent HD superfamily phosphohydrolase
MVFILQSTNKYSTYINSQRGVSVADWTSDVVYHGITCPIGEVYTSLTIYVCVIFVCRLLDKRHHLSNQRRLHMPFTLQSTKKYNTYINSQQGVNVADWTSDAVYLTIYKQI